MTVIASARMRGLFSPGGDLGHGAPPSHRIWRITLCVALLAAATSLVVFELQIREMESAIASWIGVHILGWDIVRQDQSPIMFITIPDDGSVTQWIGLKVTSECTVALLVAPLLGLAAMLILGRRLSIRAVLVATLLATLLFVAVNSIRLLFIAGSTHEWGLSAFRWSHEIYGSIISIVGICVGILVFLKLLTRLSRNHRIQESSS